MVREIVKMLCGELNFLSLIDVASKQIISVEITSSNSFIYVFIHL